MIFLDGTFSDGKDGFVYAYACVDDFTRAVLDREADAGIKRQMGKYMIEWVK